MPAVTDSKHIEWVVWHEGILTIRFHSGDVYDYFDVPSGMFDELMSAPSKSSFFRNEIKGRFEYARQ